MVLWKIEYLLYYSCGALSICKFDVNDVSQNKLRGQLIVKWHCQSVTNSIHCLNARAPFFNEMSEMKGLKELGLKELMKALYAVQLLPGSDGTKNSRFNIKYHTHKSVE